MQISVHPLLSMWLTQVSLVTLFEDLLEDETTLFNYIRMLCESFDELYGILRKQIQKVNTNMKHCISAKEQLAVTLRYVAKKNITTWY